MMHQDAARGRNRLMVAGCPSPSGRDEQCWMDAEIAVIADDLTGAMDTGVQFCKNGMRTVVYFGGCLAVEKQGSAIKPEVIVIDTDTRWESPGRAYEKVRKISEILKLTGIKRVYKKVDSTLRGNVGSELNAVMDAWNAHLAYVAPAFPAMRRVTVDGRQLLNGKPLEDTEIASDLISPARSSYIPEILEYRPERKIAHIGLQEIEMGEHSLVERIAELVREGMHILVLDAVTQDHLGIIARAIAKSEFHEVMCGSAGLAAELPGAFGLVGRKPCEIPRLKKGLPALVVAGSRSQITQEQLRFLGANKDLPVRWLTLDIDETVSGRTSPVINERSAGNGAMLARREVELQEQGELIARDAIQALEDGKSVVVSVRPENGGGSESWGDSKEKEGRLGDMKTLPDDGFRPRIDLEEAHSDIIDLSQSMVDQLGRIARRVIDAAPVSGIVLTGGDTAASVCRAISASGIALLDEILPGIPLGEIIGGPFEGLVVVTKAGAFGDERALADVLNYLIQK